jgi:hypothetical protein
MVLRVSLRVQFGPRASDVRAGGHRSRLPKPQLGPRRRQYNHDNDGSQLVVVILTRDWENKTRPTRPRVERDRANRGCGQCTVTYRSQRPGEQGADSQTRSGCAAVTGPLEAPTAGGVAAVRLRCCCDAEVMQRLCCGGAVRRSH